MITWERFSAGERFAVDPNEIERELAAVWRAAGQASDGKQPVTRACLWNVLVHVEGRERAGHRETTHLESVVKSLPRYLAARALVLRTLPSAEWQPELRSWISANCILTGGGGKMVCSEEISLETRGKGDQHLPSLVRALLVPGVPTASVFGTVPNVEDAVLAGLVNSSDAILVRSDRSSQSSVFTRLLNLGEHRTVIDLGWVEQQGVRQAIASLFDGAEQEAHSIQEVRAEVTQQDHIWAAMMLGWVAQRLGAESVESSDGTTLVVKTNRGTSLRLHIKECEAREPSIHFVHSEYPRVVRVTRDGELELERPSGVRRVRAMVPTEGAELWSQALLGTGDNDIFYESLRWAKELGR